MSAGLTDQNLFFLTGYSIFEKFVKIKVESGNLIEFWLNSFFKIIDWKF
jgi:hypothetical protein